MVTFNQTVMKNNKNQNSSIQFKKNTVIGLVAALVIVLILNILSSFFFIVSAVKAASIPP